MGNLSDLIAKQAAAKAAQTQPKQEQASVARQPTPPVSESAVLPRPRFGSKVQPDQHSADKAVADSVPSQPAPTPEAAPAPAAPKQPSLLARFGAGRASQGGNGGADKPVVDSAGSQDDDARGPAPVSGSLDSLDDLANATGGEALRETSGQALMLGETPATAPTRDLPEDMEDGMRLFVQSLDSLYDTLFDSELFSNVTRNIMQELADNREYAKLIADSDVHIMIKGMREAMGLARIKKVETKAKKPASTAKSRSSKVTDDDLALLESMNLGGLSLD